MKTKPTHLDRVAIAKAQYWNANIRVVLTLMGLFPLGFWMAQQGTTIAFIVIVFCYVFIMKRLDGRYARRVCNDEGAQDS